MLCCSLPHKGYYARLTLWLWSRCTVKKWHWKCDGTEPNWAGKQYVGSLCSLFVKTIVRVLGGRLCVAMAAQRLFSVKTQSTEFMDAISRLSKGLNQILFVHTRLPISAPSCMAKIYSGGILLVRCVPLSFYDSQLDWLQTELWRSTHHTLRPEAMTHPNSVHWWPKPH